MNKKCIEKLVYFSYELILISIVIMSSNCNTDKENKTIIRRISNFNHPEQNISMAKDLSDFSFFPLLETEFPNMERKVLEGIVYKYNVSKDKTVDFRVYLSKGALQHKSEIINFFTNKVDSQIHYLTRNADTFQMMKEFASNISDKIDEKEYDSVWEALIQIAKNNTTKENFIKVLVNREGIVELGGKRFFRSKQFYKNEIGKGIENVYAINFGYSNNPEIIEQYLLQMDFGKIKIVTYTFRVPDK